MRNLRKLLAVLVAVMIVVATMVPAFAADSYSYADQAKKLNDMGLFQGLSNTTFEPGLGLALDRQTGIVMLLRLLGLESKATAMTDADVTAALAKFTDKGDIADWAKNAVAYAVKNNLVQGVADTVVGPKLNLTGKMYATMILRNLGYTVEGTAYDTAAAMLADKGGLTPTQALQFNDKALIRDDLVGISFGSLQAKYSNGTVVIDKLIADNVVAADKAVAAGVSASITALANPTDITVTVGDTITLPTTVKATLSNNTTKDVAVTWDKTVDANTVATTTLTGTVANTTLTASMKVIVAAKAFAVTDVSLVNAATIKVTFSQNVDLNTAKTANNYKVNGTAGGGAIFAFSNSSIAASANTVTITSTGFVANDVSFTFEVTSGVLSATFAQAPSYKKVLTAADTTAPTISTITATAGASGYTTAVTVAFSEPVQSIGTYKIDGVTASAARSTTATTINKVTLTAGQNLVPNTTYTLVASAASDGINVAPTYTQTFTVTSDTVLPQVVSVGQKGPYIAVTFDKDLSADNNTVLTPGFDVKAYKTGDNNNYAQSVKKDPDNAKNLLITVTTPLNVYGSTGGTTATLELTVKNVRDSNSNIMAGTYTTTMTLTKDAVAPTLVSATLNSNNNQEILLQFSEPVNTATANSLLGSILCQKVETAYAEAITPTDKLVKADWTDYTASSYSTYIKISLAAALSAGNNYQFTIPASAYKDEATNGNAKFTFVVTPTTPTDSVKPTVTATYSYDGANKKNIVTATFSEDVNVADAVNIANYTLDGAAIPSGTIIINTSATSTQANVFTLTFASADVNTSGNVVLVVSNIRDKAGNVINSTSATLPFVDTKAPALTSAAATAKDTVELTFSENLGGFASVQDGVTTFDVKVTDGTTTVTFATTIANTTMIGSKLIVKDATKDMTAINFANARVEILANIAADQSTANNKNGAKASTANFAIADKFCAATPRLAAVMDRTTVDAAYDKDNYTEIGLQFTESLSAANDGISTYKIYLVNPALSASIVNVADLNNYVPVATYNRAQIAKFANAEASGASVALDSAFTYFSDGQKVSTFNGFISVIVVGTDYAGNTAILYNQGGPGTALNIAD